MARPPAAGVACPLTGAGRDRPMEHTGGGDAPLGPVDPLVVPRFAGPATFARLPAPRPGRPVRRRGRRRAVRRRRRPTGPGARFGPRAIRAGSRLLRGYHPGSRSSRSRDQQVADAGDIAVHAVRDRRGDRADRGRARGRCSPTSAHLVVLGGDHTSRCRCCARCTRGTGRSRWSTSTPTSTPGTRTSARRTRTARRSAARSRRGCSRPTAACTSGSAGRCYAGGPRRRRRVRVHDRRRVRLPDDGRVDAIAERGARAGGRRAGLRLDRRRRDGSGARAGHRYARGRRAHQPRAARHAARRSRACGSSAPTSSRWRPRTTTREITAIAAVERGLRAARLDRPRASLIRAGVR